MPCYDVINTCGYYVLYVGRMVVATVVVGVVLTMIVLGNGDHMVTLWRLDTALLEVEIAMVFSDEI